MSSTFSLCFVPFHLILFFILKVSQPESGESSDEAEMPSTVTKQSSISPVNGVSATGVTNSSTHGLQKSSAMIYDTSVNKTTVTSTGGGNNGKKGTWL